MITAGCRIRGVWLTLDAVGRDPRSGFVVPAERADFLKGRVSIG
jgi:hypothetical protein